MKNIILSLFFLTLCACSSFAFTIADKDKDGIPEFNLSAEPEKLPIIEE